MSVDLERKLYKAVGRGLAISMASFSIEVKAGEIRLITEAEGDFLFKRYQIDKGYELAACSKGESLPDRINKVDLSAVKN